VQSSSLISQLQQKFTSQSGRLAVALELLINNCFPFAEVAAHWWRDSPSTSFGTSKSEGPLSVKIEAMLRSARPAPNFKCPNCGKRYTWKETLSRHMKFECNKEPQWQCPLCPAKFKRKDHMLTHVNSRRHQLMN